MLHMNTGAEVSLVIRKMGKKGKLKEKSYFSTPTVKKSVGCMCSEKSFRALDLISSSKAILNL